MNRFLGRCPLIACVTAIVAITVAVQPAWAQRGRGMGRIGMFPPALVATLDEVQTDLKLTDEQKTEVTKIIDDTRSKVRELFSDGGRRRPDFEAYQKLNEESTANIEKALEPAQFERLQQITLQVNGASALNDAALREKLHFTDEQTAKYEEARDANREAMQDAMDGMDDLSRDERRAKMDELRKTADEQLLAVLTPEQKTEFEAMKGAPLEIDLTQLRGRFGGGRGRNN